MRGFLHPLFESCEAKSFPKWTPARARTLNARSLGAFLPLRERELAGPTEDEGVARPGRCAPQAAVRATRGSALIECCEAKSFPTFGRKPRTPLLDSCVAGASARCILFLEPSGFSL